MPTITLTENAAKRVQTMLDNRGKGLGLRLGVTTSGCSGFAYVLDFADSVESNDQAFEQFGVKIVVKSDDLQYLDGTEIDYIHEGLNQTFQFNNPNVTNTCGCGESFAV